MRDDSSGKQTSIAPVPPSLAESAAGGIQAAAVTAVPTVGWLLRQERQRQGLSLDRIYAAIRVTRGNLAAIEADDYEHLPADAYTSAFVAMYARQLGLDGKTLARQFLHERDSHQGGRKRCWFWFRRSDVSTLAAPILIAPAAAALALLSTIMLTMVIFCGYTGWNPLAYFWGQLRATAVPEQSYHPAHPGTSVAATAKAINLEAHFLKDTEVVLQLDNGNEVRAIYTRASTANWEADASLSIEFAEPSSAVLRLNGQPLGFPLSKNGHYKIRLRVAPAAS
ncbi:helix-turn-helix domain-containing protein [Desulfobulbus oralis]|uniref:DUF4115 domain-containing protein n=1 Tax=Desulfobulbus oralis TaxID=1986146 RepID=A0A2L1GQ49_9BACT|nr:helix-turn-helix transcriptional regulator [Desulfobulbus oralis]AVD71800.1 hypothetical protein CAY53_10270 [Desulfobulbus oralis]